MKLDDAFQRYFREYLFYAAVSRAREDTAEVVPISMARAINARIAARTGDKGTGYLRIVDEELSAAIPGYQPQFGDHTGHDPRCQEIWKDFLARTGTASSGAWRSPQLPISPYDPRWADRASVKGAGTALTYLDAEELEAATGGALGAVHEPQFGDLTLWTLGSKDKPVAAGPALSDEDAAGLSALMGLMSHGDYARVKDWVLAGARDPRTGVIDRSAFMSPPAVARSVAVLTELQRQGLTYEVQRDLHPGQIKAHIAGTGMDVRLLDSRENEARAGARIYDNGEAIYFGTNHRSAPGKYSTYTPTPAECVDLLHVAQGLAVPRRDDSGATVGVVGTYPSRAWNATTHSYEPAAAQASFYSGKASTYVFKPYEGPGARPGDMVTIHRNAEDRGLARFFGNTEVADQYLRDAVDSARANFTAALDVEGLIAHYDEQNAALVQRVASWDGEASDARESQIQPPQFSVVPEIASIQRSYWDVLIGTRDRLLRPGVTEDMYAMRLGQIGDRLDDLDELTGTMSYLGDAAEQVRSHAGDLVEELIGTAEPMARVVDDQIVEQRFDPVRVASWMTSETGQWRNLDSLAAALRRCEVGPDELLGTGFNVSRMKDRLVRFEEDTAVDITSVDSEFIGRMGQVVREAITRGGALPGDVRIDNQGVISWTASRMTRGGKPEPVYGVIGQVFDVGEHGEIITRFASGENTLIVPGYEARIAAQLPGESKSVEERTVLRGYEQLMTEQIQYQIAGDLLSGRTEVGEGASLSPVYSRLYGTKHPVDYLAAEPSAPENAVWKNAVLATEARRVRYTNEIKEGSTVHAEYTAAHNAKDPADDNHFDAWELTDGRNMAVMTGEDRGHHRPPTGFFDPVMTGSAKNQGIVRYLVEGASVNPDGSISPSDDPADRTPLMKREELDTCRFDPFDRQQMTASALTQSAEVTEPTGVALMTFGGWTADDPIVISTEFASQHQIRGVDGQLRDLVVGDKLSDLHGNKGVISLVVDRDMPDFEAHAEGLDHEVAWFKANPDMDVVMSPFSLISRRNAGSARELMGEQVHGLYSPSTESSTVGALGQMRFIVTHLAVDAKTKVYDDEAIASGQGRKASSQLAWALGAQDCPSIMAEFYGHNSGAEANFRELLGAVGVTTDAGGTLGIAGDADTSAGTGPARRLFEMPELVHSSRGTLSTASMRRDFGARIGNQGGDMEIPWPLRMPTGELTTRVSAHSWALPVLSSHLRSGQEFEDGTLVAHDYTSRYLDIYEEAFKYRDALERIPALQGECDQLEAAANAVQPGTREHRTAEKDLAARRGRLARQERVRDTAQRNAQLKYDAITADIAMRSLSGRKNVFKDQLMSARLPDSATAVWTADPRLDIDQVAMGPAMAQALGLDEGDHALIWRDPILHDAGLRYLRVTLDDRLTGVAINPVMDQCFDGDFDGDSVAVVKLHSQAAHREALDKLSVPANLLQMGVCESDGSHPLAMQRSLDTQVALSKNPELTEEFAALTAEANLLAHEDEAFWSQAEARQGHIDLHRSDWDPYTDEQEALHDDIDEHIGEIRARREEVTGQLSDLYRQAQRNEFGTALRFDNVGEHLRSVVEVCVETGAKGSMAKAEDYMRYLGAEPEDGAWDLHEAIGSVRDPLIRDIGEPGITEQDQQDSMYATAVKTFGTGLAGSFSQRAVRALRNTDLKAVLELTYPVTQSILQAKHDAAEARHKYEMLMGPGRDLWRGRLLEREGGRWKPVFADGAPVQADMEQWKQQFVEFYESSDGFNVPGVNTKYVERVARSLADEHGVMRNLENDPGLSGELMDQMAYGGDLTGLIDAARDGRNIFDGTKNEQFACRTTSRARSLAGNRSMSLGDFASLTSPESVIESEVVKADVLADEQDGAAVRGAGKRSTYAVSANTPVVAASYSSGVIEPVSDDEYSFGF